MAPSSLMRRLALFFVPAAFGAFFALAAPPTNLYPALWLGMAGLAWTLDEDRTRHDTPRARRALAGFERGILFGAGANVVALRFVPTVIERFTPLPYAAGVLALTLLSLFEGLRWAAAGVVCRALRRVMPLPPAFAIAVFVGTFVPTVFPWSAAGGVTPWPAMVQLADMIGERGVTLLMALSAGFVAHAIRAKKPLALAFAAAIPLATLAYGAHRIRAVDEARADAKTVRVALLQPSVPPLDRWDPKKSDAILEKLTQLTRVAEKDKRAQLVVWPEAAYPIVLPHANRAAPIGKSSILPYGVRGPVLTGIILSEGRGVDFNSALLARSDGTLSDPQDKQHLLWFGETVPLADKIAWLRTTFARGTGLTPGDKTVLQTTGPIRAGVLNCFEDTLPEAAREIDAAGPNLLVNVTNDAWFAGTQESELHLRLAALRAVELRRDLVRSVNFGPTTWVDAAGRVRGRYASDFAGSLLAEPALLDGARTIYSRAGDAPVALACAIAAAAAAWWTSRRRRALR